MAPIEWIVARIGDELGFAPEDLSTLYGVEISELGGQLETLGEAPEEIVTRILADLDALRVGYRQIQVSDDQIRQTRAILADYLFHPLIRLETADQHTAWRLSGDDAQYVAFRSADILGLDFAASDTLRLRLNRLALRHGEALPPVDERFRDLVADVTFYLAEFSGVL
jgi:hypothetical protein